MAEGGTKPKWFVGKFFEPATDFYALLDEQAAKTLEGVKALDDWIRSGSEERCQIVRDLESEADLLKLELAKKLFESFVTPFDREDIYDISVRLDEVINGAKSIVREIEAFEVSTSRHPHIAEMSVFILEGTQCLAASIHALRNNLSEATEQANKARKSENRVNKIYRLAMKELIKIDDIKLILKVKEVYQQLVLTAERIDRVGEKLLYAIVKLA